MTKLAIVLPLAVLVCSCGGEGHGFGDDGSGDLADAGSGGTTPRGGGSTGNNGGGGSGGGGGSSGGNPGTPGGGGSGGDDGGSASTGDDGGDPYGTPPQCSSGKTWALGDTGNPEMHPGVACDSCHKVLGSATKFPFDIAGTVYPTAHEPDDCYGVSSAQVVITDANKTDHTFAVNAAGNFYNLNYVLIGAIPTPYTAKVVANGKERPMITPQTNGDCNLCHTENGAQAAPGRILMP